MGTWNWLDCILAAIVVASIVAAIMKGFVQELIALASVVIGLVVAAIGYTRAALWFEDLTKSHEIALGLGFLSPVPGHAAGRGADRSSWRESSLRPQELSGSTASWVGSSVWCAEFWLTRSC